MVPMKKKFLKALLITMLGSVFLLVGCGKKTEPNMNELTLPVETEEEPEVEEELPEVNLHEGERQDLLTGQWVPEETAKQRPMAVMIGNTVDALPQYGVGEADVLYECPVEGGLTRLMAIFSDYTKAEKIGSVRSCRLYFAYFAKEYDAMYTHFGQAVYALDFLNSDQIDNLSGLDGSISSTFYRDSSRKAPHNAFTSPQGLDEGIATKNYRTEYDEEYTGHFLFADPDEDKIVLDGADAAVMRPGYPIDKPWFVYDKDTDTYKRFQYKQAHIDGANDQQLSFTNVIFQNMDYEVIDQKGYLEFNTVGTGTGKYFTGGKVVDITWKKEDINSPAIFYDASGEQLKMNPGKTCVCIIETASVDNISIYASENEFEAPQP